MSGKTLYTLKPSKTACTAACLKSSGRHSRRRPVWPRRRPGPECSVSKLGTVKRNGAVQVTYGGKPLYFFVGDTAAGQVKGNVTDTWGKWTAVVTKKSGASSSGSNSGSGNSSAGGGGAAF